METFLATLTQTIAALVAILLAAVAAYYIFLQSKGAEYDDKIQAEQSSIRSDIAKLQSQWPSSIAMFLPPEFKERFSVRTQNSHGAQLVNKLATSVIFASPELKSALEDVRPYDSFSIEHWQGRVYFLALDEAVRVLSGGAPLAAASFTGEPVESRPEAVAAFPRSPMGPGFGDWRSDFDLISASDFFTAPYADSAQSDFKAFLDSHPRPNNAVLLDLYSRGVSTFHGTVGSIRNHVHNIDELELAKSRYSFGLRVHGLPLVLLIFLASLTGVVVPLFALAINPRITAVWATSILIASLALVVGSFLQFGWDILKPLGEDRKLYVADHWLRPILEDVNRDSATTDSGSNVSLDRVAEFLASSATPSLPPEILGSLRKYEAAGVAYNNSVDELNAVVFRTLQEPALKAFTRPYIEAQGRSQYSVLHPNVLADVKQWEQLSGTLLGAPDIFLAVEVPTYWGSRGKLSLFAPPEQRQAFLKTIGSFVETIASTEQARNFSQHRTAVRASALEVREHLAKFLKP